MAFVLEVSLHPGRVRGLDHFTVQIVSQEAGPVGVSRRVKVWKAARTYAAVSLLKLNRVDFEEGWHHVRVLPWTVDGDPIPTEEPAEPTGSRANESEPFYVLPDASIDEEPPQRAVPKALSVEHARLDRQFAAVMQGRAPAEVVPRSIGWIQRRVSARAAAQVSYRSQVRHRRHVPDPGGALAQEHRAAHPGSTGTTRELTEDVVILTPAAKVEERRREYPGITVLPIAFAASELKASHWKFLMGAVGSQSMYIRQLALIHEEAAGRAHPRCVVGRDRAVDAVRLPQGTSRCCA